MDEANEGAPVFAKVSFHDDDDHFDDQDDNDDPYSNNFDNKGNLQRVHHCTALKTKLIQ